MAVEVSDVFYFALESELFGQQVFNTFACRVATVPPATSEEDWVNNWFNWTTGWFSGAGSIVGELRSLMSGDVTLKRWHVRRVTPNPNQPVVLDAPAGLTGDNAGSCETSNTALSITRKGVLAGRRYKGRIAVAGLPQEVMINGFWDAPTITAAGLAGVSLTGLKTRVAGDAVRMGFWSPQHISKRKSGNVLLTPLFVETNTYTVQRTIRVQRSRTVGVGK